MDFGITVATAADSWKIVKRAEELGFTYAWFYDTQMLNADPFVAMAAAAVHTRTIHLGTGDSASMDCCGSHSHEGIGIEQDRKSTRLNSSHLGISYAVFCL